MWAMCIHNKYSTCTHTANIHSKYITHNTYIQCTYVCTYVWGYLLHIYIHCIPHPVEQDTFCPNKAEMLKISSLTTGLHNSYQHTRKTSTLQTQILEGSCFQLRQTTNQPLTDYSNNMNPVIFILFSMHTPMSPWQ